MSNTEQRAEAFADGIYPRYAISLWNVEKNGYIHGASEQIALDAKWIHENIGADVAVDFLKAMEG